LIARKAILLRIEVVARPLRSSDRPFVLVSLDEAIDMPHLQLHPWVRGPAVALALEEAVEEALLQLDPVVGVEVRPMLDTMRFQPLFLRCGAHEALEVPARVQPLPAPVGGGQKRHGDPVPARRARLVILVVERMRADLRAEIASVA